MDWKPEREASEIFRDIAIGVAALSIVVGIMKGITIADILLPKAVVTIENMDRAAIATGAAAGNVEKATRALKEQEDAQVKSINALSTQMITLVADTDTMINSVNTSVLTLNSSVKANSDALVKFTGDTNANLNGKMFPALVKSIADTQSQVTTLALGMQKSQEKLIKLTADMDALVADPNNKKTLENIQVGTANLAETSGHLANMAKRLDTPKKFAEMAATAIFNAGAKVASFLTLFVH